jgi:tRNA pseudouridine55 synthase
MGSPLNGLFLVDKPAGMTSHDVVARARKLLRQSSIGHTGTLDPMATGLMILVLGEATKLSDYLLATDKTYRLSVRFGVTTDTLDREGKILSETPCDLRPEKVLEVALAQQGEFEWPIPLFSAAKVDGRKLYELARRGEVVETPTKKMRFWGAKVHEVAPQGIQLELSCAKGGFIRTWASQLGERLGVGGILEDLRRLRVGDWSADSAVPLEDLPGALEARRGFIPLSESLPQWKQLMASEKDARLMRNGQIPRDLANRLVFEQKQAFASGDPVFVKVISELGELLAILAAEPGKGLKIRRVFRSIT